ncbi:Peroxiredoxin [Cyphellophora attinorum]|uniref:thioredoxin-dependent peroxiredoxin n=1 Tax=Cyphellophora attinorum TaxID=1664694 RepID=A0A0N1GZS2_9EURO|nr:Peroxiredoxin [Phialophora attinorum]KPI36822.1 Peroxiredoxin [Phialophora attinorum]
MVELRKRPAREDPVAPPAKRSSSKTNAKQPSKVKQVVTKAKEAIAGPTKSEETTATDLPAANSQTGVVPETTGTAGEGVDAAPATTSTNAAAPAPATGRAAAATVKQLGSYSVGTKVDLNGFGGTVTTHDGKKVTLGELASGAEKGVVVFTYPKASTPGCTTQACLFRDNYKPIGDAGYAVYGLSTDSEKSNTNFVTKKELPYPLLCDPKASLTHAIGMKKPGSTTRGVVVLDKDGTVRVWQQAGPQATLDAVLGFLK